MKDTMAAKGLEPRAEQLASELATRGVTCLSLPQAAVDRAASIFEHISTDILADEGRCMNFEPPKTWPQWPRCCRRFLLPCLPVQQLNFFVEDQGDSENEEEFLRYANAARSYTLEELAEPFEEALEPLTRQFFGANERVVTVNAQFIYGNAKTKTEAHRDFFSRNTISLLTPLYEYSPDEASLHYWRFDENPELYRTKSLAKARRRRTHWYRRGEAVVFSGDLFHQTAPFKRPVDGWGSRQCRALFCLVLVGANALQSEKDYEAIVKNLRGPAGGYMVDPETEEFVIESVSSEESDSEEAT
mmetsp:Transcript_115143/g.229336  ORF Transcript_115143/g.229336 Transcript_115143/m.229336 type:complete len:302 (+) Transcript_115143:73-978(+)